MEWAIIGGLGLGVYYLMKKASPNAPQTSPYPTQVTTWTGPGMEPVPKPEPQPVASIQWEGMSPAQTLAAFKTFDGKVLEGQLKVDWDAGMEYLSKQDAGFKNEYLALKG